MKIQKYFDKKSKEYKFRTRFEINKKTFKPTAHARAALITIINEIRSREDRVKQHLPVEQPVPTVKELFDEYKLRIKDDRKKKSIFERVSTKFLELLPPALEITSL